MAESLVKSSEVEVLSSNNVHAVAWNNVSSQMTLEFEEVYTFQRISPDPNPVAILIPRLVPTSMRELIRHNFQLQYPVFQVKPDRDKIFNFSESKFL